MQVHLSWAPTDDEARAIAHDQWRTGLLPGPLVWELDSPEAFDARTADATPGEVAETMQVLGDEVIPHLDAAPLPSLSLAPAAAG